MIFAFIVMFIFALLLFKAFSPKQKIDRVIDSEGKESTIIRDNTGAGRSAARFVVFAFLAMLVFFVVGIASM